MTVLGLSLDRMLAVVAARPRSCYLALDVKPSLQLNDSRADPWCSAVLSGVIFSMRHTVKSMFILAIAGCGALAKLGVAQASPDVPKWCASADASEMKSGSSFKRAMGADGVRPRDQLYALVASTCAPDDEATAHMAELAAERKRWSARLELNEDDWADLGAWASLGASRRNDLYMERSKEDLTKRPWPTLDPIEQWERISWDLDHGDPGYIADALGPKLSELGRLGYVMLCIASDDNVSWAMCQGDIDHLDFKRVAAEVRADKKYAPAEKGRLRFHLGVNVREKLLAAHVDKIKKLIAGDPGYAKMFEVVAAARKEWSERSKATPALLDLVTEMEVARAKNTRSAYAGCEDKTRAAWRSVVAAIPAKSFEGLSSGGGDESGRTKSFGEFGTRQILATPDGYLASIALVMCLTPDKDTKADYLTWSLGKYASDLPGFRGPRTAGATALLGAGITFDARGVRLNFPPLRRSLSSSVAFPPWMRGVIAKVTPSGDTVTVTFKKQMITETQCDDYKTTNKIIQFRTDGSPVYDTICTRNKKVTFDSSDPPQTVPAHWLEGAKPGMFVSIVGDVALAVWAKPTSTTPILVYGVPVK